MAGGVEYQVTKVDPTNPETKGMVYQVHKVSEEVAATLGGKVYRARIVKVPDDPEVSGKVYQIVIIDDPDDPSVKGKVFNAILTGDQEVVVVGPAVPPLDLDSAVANTLTSVKAFGGTELDPATPDPATPSDIYCNNGKISVLDHTNWNVITNPTSQPGQGMFINTSGVLSRAGDRGAGVFIPVTVGKKYTVLINKRTADLGTIIRYGQSNNSTPPATAEQLLDWYRGTLTDGMIISFTAKRPYFVMQLSANLVEATGGIDNSVEVIEAAGDNETIAIFDASYDNAYDEVPYLEADGTGAYIDTGFKPDSNTKVEVKFALTSALGTQCLIGGRNSSTSPRNSFAVWAAVTSKPRFDYGSNQIAPNDGIGTTEHIVIKQGRYNTLDGVEQSANLEETFACNYNMALFAMNTGDAITNNSYINGKVYYAKIWNGSTLVRDFVPVRRRADGELGMYDKVNSVFYANAGTGDFTTSYQTATANNLFAINTYKDVQEIITGATTHNCGVRVLDGTENWTFTSGSNCPARFALENLIKGVPNTKVAPFVCSHFIPAAWNDISVSSRTTPYIIISNTPTPYIAFTVGWDNTITDLDSWKAFLAAQYAAGTPVIVVYPLATPFEEVAPIAQSMTVVDGDNTVLLTQQGMTPLELEATYTQQQ